MTTVALDSITRAALAALWSGVVDTAAFALLVALAIAAVRPAAATRHKLWSLVILLAVAVPLASFAASLGRVRTISRPPAAAPMKTIATVRATAVFPASVVRGAALRSATPAASRRPAPIEIVIGATAICGAILGMWLFVAFYKNVELATELFALARVKRRARPLDADAAIALPAFRATARSGRSAVLAISDDVNVPCAAGLWSPAILLPANVVATATPSDVDRIAMHEYAHLRRYDDWTNFAERLVGATFWFNPAVMLAKRRIAIDREIACDDWVVERTGGAHGYASCLFRLAAAQGVARTPAQALGALGDSKSIAARIEHLVATTGAPRRSARMLPIGLSALAFVLVAGQAMRAPAIAVEAPAAAPVAPVAPSLAASPAAASAETALPAETAAPIATAAPHATSALREISSKARKPQHAFVLRTIVLHRAVARVGGTRARARTIVIVRVDDASASQAPITQPANVRLLSSLAQQAPVPPDVPYVSPDGVDDIDATVEHLTRGAEAVAERANAHRFRAEQRQLAAQIKASVMNDVQRHLQDLRREVADEAIAERARAVDMQTNREEVRAALEIVKQSEHVRKEAIARALEELRSELEPEPTP